MPRSAALIGYGDDDDLVGLQPIDQVEGKTMQDCSTGLVSCLCAYGGMLSQQLEGAVDCPRKIPAYGRPGVKEVVIHRLIEFHLGQRVPNVLHAPDLRSFCSMRASTSSPGINSTVPASISAMRRAISVSQAACTSSRGVALAQSKSARSARCSGASCMASTLASSKVVAMMNSCGNVFGSLARRLLRDIAQ